MGEGVSYAAHLESTRRRCPRGGGGWVGGEGLDPSPLRPLDMRTAFGFLWEHLKSRQKRDSGGQGRGTDVATPRGEHILLRAASDGAWARVFDFWMILPAGKVPAGRHGLGGSS